MKSLSLLALLFAFVTIVFGKAVSDVTPLQKSSYGLNRDDVDIDIDGNNDVDLMNIIYQYNFVKVGDKCVFKEGTICNSGADCTMCFHPSGIFYYGDIQCQLTTPTVGDGDYFKDLPGVYYNFHIDLYGKMDCALKDSKGNYYKYSNYRKYHLTGELPKSTIDEFNDAKNRFYDTCFVLSHTFYSGDNYYEHNGFKIKLRIYK